MASKSVQQIIVDRLVEKIQSDNMLPWHKPFIGESMNWYSKHEYRGINRLILEAGEYITVNQLKEFNKKKGVNFWFASGTKYNIVVFYKVTDKRVSKKEAENSSWGRIFEKNGEYFRRSWVLRYYRVYNILNIKDKDGNTLEPKMGNTVVESYTPVDDMVNGYLNKSGVGVKHDGGGKCYYTERDDIVHMTKQNYFACTEAYYRTLFHELVHSTGIERRLNRESFKLYDHREERSREEIIAEVGSLLLASEAGFRDNVTWMDNSDNYIMAWVVWMKDHVNEVVNGMLAAEKAKQYILGEDASDEALSSVKIE